LPLKAIRFATDHDGVYTTSIGSHAPNAQTWLVFIRYRVTRIALGRQMCAMSMEANNGTADYFLCPESTNNSDSVESHDGVQGGFLITTAPVGAGQWWCIAETNNNATPATILYSQRVGYPGAMTQTSGNNHASFTDMTRLIVGTDDAQPVTNSPQNEWLDGDIAGIKIWDHALTAAELEKEKGQLWPVKTTGLKFFYDFQDLVTGLQDQSGNGLGTLGDIQGVFGFPSGTPGRTLVNDGPDIPYHPVTASGGANTVANVGLGLFDPDLVPKAIGDEGMASGLGFFNAEDVDISNPAAVRNAAITQSGVGPLGVFLDEFFRDDQPLGYVDDDFVIAMAPPAGTTYTANLSETVTVSEALAAQANFTQGLPETVSAGESVAPQLVANVGLSESATAGESIAVNLAFPVPLAETVTAGEALATQLVANVGLSEAPPFGEALSIVAGFNVGLPETVTASEAIAAGLLFTANLSETVTAGEALAVQLQVSVALSEAPPVSEALSVAATLNLGLSESVAASEVLVAGLLFAANLSESVGAVGESLAVGLTAIASLSESAAASESLATQALFAQALSETATASELLSAGQVFPLALSESVGAVGESISVVLRAAANLSESVTASDALSSAATFTQALAESAAAGEQLAVQLRAVLGLAEGAAVGESVDATIPAFHQFFADLTETVTVLEQLTVGVVHRPPGEFFFFGYAPAASSLTGYTPATTLAFTGYAPASVPLTGYAPSDSNLTGYAQ
jgi:hypothetical protein